MNVDLITIYPGVAFETKKWDWGKEIDDEDAYDCVSFGNNKIFSYKKMHEDSSILDGRYYKYMEELSPKIVDFDGKRISDYAMVFDKNIFFDFEHVPTTASQHLVTFFSYQHNLDHWVDIDSIHVVFFERGGHRIYLKGRHRLGVEFSFLLPIPQDAKPKIKLRAKTEKALIDMFRLTMTRHNDAYRRLINAISLFNESCRIYRVNPNGSIVLIVSAFESLFNLPKYSKTDNFCYAFRIFWGYDERIEQWAKELYELRCEIVHGSVVEAEKLLVSRQRHYPHFEIARDTFFETLLTVLEGYGYLSVSKEAKLKSFDRVRMKIVSNKEKVESILKQSKKYNYKSFSQKVELYKEFLSQIESYTLVDYSALEILPKLFNLIYKVAKDWIADDLRKDYHFLVERGFFSEEAFKNFIISRRKTLKNILGILKDIKSIKMSPRGRGQLLEKRIELLKELRNVDGISYNREEFRFTIAEFLTRSVEALL